MEIISLTGYTEEEKMHIARRTCIPRQLAEHGLTPDAVIVDDARAAGRDRASTRARPACATWSAQIGTIARKIAAEVATRPDGATPASRRSWTAPRSTTTSGPARFKKEVAFRTSRPGVATGLAWTEAGGDVLFIEATLLPGGNQHIILTGQLGNVMQESARAAVSHIRSQRRGTGHRPDFLDQARPARARARRRDSEGWPVGGRDDGHGDPLGGTEPAGARRTWR